MTGTRAEAREEVWRGGSQAPFGDSAGRRRCVRQGGGEFSSRSPRRANRRSGVRAGMCSPVRAEAGGATGDEDAAPAMPRVLAAMSGTSGTANRHWQHAFARTPCSVLRVKAGTWARRAVDARALAAASRALAGSHAEGLMVASNFFGRRVARQPTRSDAVSVCRRPVRWNRRAAGALVSTLSDFKRVKDGASCASALEHSGDAPEIGVRRRFGIKDSARAELSSDAADQKIRPLPPWRVLDRQRSAASLASSPCARRTGARAQGGCGCGDQCAACLVHEALCHGVVNWSFTLTRLARSFASAPAARVESREWGGPQPQRYRSLVGQRGRLDARLETRWRFLHSGIGSAGSGTSRMDERKRPRALEAIACPPWRRSFILGDGSRSPADL